MHITIVSREDLLPAVHGAAVKIVRTAEGLSRHGVDVTVVTGDRLHYHRYVGGRHELLEYPPRLLGATRVGPRRRALLKLLGFPDYWEAVEALLDTLGYPRDEHILYRPIVDPDFWLRTLWVGRKHGTDWFQAEFPGFALPAWMAARVLRRRCSLVQHNVEWKRMEDTIDLHPKVLERVRGIELQLAHLMDEVIVVSREDRDLMLADDFEREELTIIPHGVDVAAFSWKTGAGIRQRYGIPADRALVFFHGTLNYWPNTVACRLFAEELLPRMRAAGMKVTVLIAGMNPPRDQYLHQDLIYAGCVDDLATHIAAADLCVVPLLDGGGTRLKILEYFAAEKAVVSTRKGAEGLLLEDGRDIHLVDDGDWDAMVGHIESLIAEPGCALAMGHHARTFVSAYDWHAVTAVYLELYERRGEVRGRDYNERLAHSVNRDPRSLDVLGESLAEERNKRHLKVLRKERKGNASKLLQGEEPRIRHWDDAGVSRELSEEDITRHIPGEITSQKPRTMILLLNKRCNLRCDFCDLWHYTDMMPFESAITIIGRAPAAGVKTLVITGGEPFVHPRIYEIIEFARNLDLGVNITTNGTLLVKDLDRLRESCVSSLSISIDGFEETHDRLRGVDGCWSQTMSAIETIQAETDIQLNIYFVVTNQNVGDLAKVYDLACERGIAFDFWPVNGYPHLYIRTPEERATYQAAIDHLAATSPMVRERLDYYRYGVEYMDGRRDHYRCLGLIEQFGVNHEGQLVPCCVWDQKGLQVGSALDEPLDQLFFSKRAQALREQIFNEGCVDQCFNHSLYEFQSATGLPFVVKPAEEPINEAMALIKESGQARGEQAKAARRAAAKARRARELADVERSRAEEPS
jgi:MoaA/NifB/PqqE/SkfB family radical SAM enzyme/glycosyltransferase involved in cell wall biosynthesis